jgi:hypothetical protein
MDMVTVSGVPSAREFGLGRKVATMKYGLAILVLLAFSAPMRADSVTDWAFNFTGQGVSGSGTFQTDSSQCGFYGCLVLNLSGNVNGTDITPDPAPASMLQSDGSPDQLFAGDSVLQFALDGTQTWIEWGQEDPLAGNIWFFGNGWDNLGAIAVDFTLTDPVATPEPGMLPLCIIGLLAVAAGFLARRVTP